MDITTMRIGVTLLSFGIFIGIMVWTYARKNKSEFDEAEQLPFLQD